MNGWVDAGTARPQLSWILHVSCPPHLLFDLLAFLGIWVLALRILAVVVVSWRDVPYVASLPSAVAVLASAFALLPRVWLPVSQVMRLFPRSPPVALVPSGGSR